MSEWQEYALEEKIYTLLADVQYYRPEHHFGRPFLTAYQLTIEFARRYPQDFDQLGYQIGGKGIGQRVSLTQYLAGQLSARMQSGEITDIEGAYLSNRHLNSIIFDHDGQKIESSLTQISFPLSMFRLHE